MKQLSDLPEELRRVHPAGLNLAQRRNCLDRLLLAINARESELTEALAADLGKSNTESVLCEIGMVREEIRYMRRRIGRFSRPRLVRASLAQFPSLCYTSPVPYGVVLILSPWNYPVLLTLGPLVDALAAGNTAVVKPSAYAPHTAQALGRLLEEALPPDCVRVVQGGREENQALLDGKYDLIFFTGSQSVGQYVLERAARHLTPVVLELGGKSPVLVDETADIRLAARRIVFGKLLNAGQTCVAPDYVLVKRERQQALAEAIVGEIHRQYGENPLTNPQYGRIINKKHLQRLRGLVDDGHLVFGGRCDGMKLEPTVLTDVTEDMAVMQQEIFGPILPLIPYETEEDALGILSRHPDPLALYLFSKSRRLRRVVLGQVRFGGGAVNDTILHLATPHMGFGGIGKSGMGQYHGRRGFETFCHARGILHRVGRWDLPLRYAPYTKWKSRLLRMIR